MFLIELNLVAGRGHPSHSVDECRAVSAGRPLPEKLGDGGIELSLAESAWQQAHSNCASSPAWPSSASFSWKTP